VTCRSRGRTAKPFCGRTGGASPRREGSFFSLSMQYKPSSSLRACNPNSIRAEVGDARRLELEDGGFDAVLLLGPLYHLPESKDRRTALAEAKRIVTPGGVVFAAGISRFAAMHDGLAREKLFERGFREMAEHDLATGVHLNPENRVGLRRPTSIGPMSLKPKWPPPD